MSQELEAPFPYFGGKASISDRIWSYLGQVKTYIEPFAGSCSVLLQRPHRDKGILERINDINGYVCNFWRAVSHEPDRIADLCDWPCIEQDLHARKKWILDQKEGLSESLESDPEWYDVRTAAWWCWGASHWIGSNWPTHSRTKPICRPQGVSAEKIQDHIHEYMNRLCERLRNVDVYCGDWTRVVSSYTMLKDRGTPCGIFLDPPYPTGQEVVYGEHDNNSVFQEAEEWCLEHGDDPDLRIVLCGFVDTYDLPETWDRYQWSRQGGYGNQSDHNEDRHQECLYISPHCLDPDRDNIVSMFQSD